MPRSSVRAIPLAAALLLLLGSALPAQDPPEESPPPGPKNTLPKPVHEEGTTCDRCGEGYHKAVAYLVQQLDEAKWQEKIPIAFLLMADGGEPEAFEKCLYSAYRTPRLLGAHSWANWFLGFGGIFLAEYYRRNPTEEVKEVLESTIEKAAEVQEPTGGWFSRPGGGKKAGYPGEDHGQLTAMLWSTMLISRKLGLEVPEDSLSRIETYMTRQCGEKGITYGTGNKSPDTTGSRGGFAALGLNFVGRRDDPVWTRYDELFPTCFKRLRRGHHIGGWHFMGVVLGTYTMNYDHFDALCDLWLEKLVSEQREDGGFYLGDNKAGGGEKHLMGGDRTSTAALALMILLRNHPNQLNPQEEPKKKKGKRGRKKKNKRKRKSPFGRD